ncbi:hypothetical protein AB0J83_29300 [Actinoplanes sp. NPDC049596]
MADGLTVSDLGQVPRLAGMGVTYLPVVWLVTAGYTGVRRRDVGY